MAVFDTASLALASSISGAVLLNLATFVFRLTIFEFSSLSCVSKVLIPVKNIEELIKLTLPLVRSSMTTPLAQAKSL